MKLKQFLAIILITSCTKTTEEKHSKLLVITVINNCYAQIKFYKENGEYYKKESFDCEYEKEVSIEFETGKYKAIAEGEGKIKQISFTKTNFKQCLQITF